jgi:ElaA protein
MPSLHDRPLAELAPETLYRILQLRAAVFVVEQDCAYLDLDDRDLEPGARQLWIADDAGAVMAAARILDDGDARRIGRVVTQPHHRHGGLASQLIEHFLATTDGPWRLEAQAHLVDWYGRFGFVADGPEYLEDGIPHVPMLRTDR